MAIQTQEQRLQQLESLVRNMKVFFFIAVVAGLGFFTLGRHAR